MLHKVERLDAGYYLYRGFKVNKLCRGRGWAYSPEGAADWCHTDTRTSAMREVDAILKVGTGMKSPDTNRTERIIRKLEFVRGLKS